MLSRFNVLEAFGFSRCLSGAPSSVFADERHVRALGQNSFLIVELGNALAHRTVASGLADWRGFEQHSASRQALPANPASPNFPVERTA